MTPSRSCRVESLISRGLDAGAAGAAPANEPPTPEAPVDFPNAPDKKETARLAKEAEKQKKEDERLKKEEEKKKKDEEKQKKKSGSDPFGDS